MHWFIKYAESDGVGQGSSSAAANITAPPQDIVPSTSASVPSTRPLPKVL